MLRVELSLRSITQLRSYNDTPVDNAMGKLNKYLSGRKNILNVYITAGYPRLHETVHIMEALAEHGADLIELGMPYSDPLADGPVIQESNAIAIANGMTIGVLFNQLRDFRKRVSIPVILMGYLNPVLQYGFEKFCQDAATCGIDGLIIPDLPEHEFSSLYKETIRSKGLDFIFLVTPQTPEKRVRELDALSSGFLYAVSASSTTGSGLANTELPGYLEKLHSYRLKNPILVGFGIGDRSAFREACSLADGAIIGSAYIKALKNSQDVNATTKSFLSSILG